MDDDLFINDSEINVDNADDCLLLNQPNQNQRQSFLEKLQVKDDIISTKLGSYAYTKLSAL